jgi:hypothetical protein
LICGGSTQISKWWWCSTVHLCENPTHNKNQKRIKKKDVKKVVIRSVGNHKSNMGRGFSQIWLYIAVKVEKLILSIPSIFLIYF